MTVFVCGALVMIFEIIGSRILSPFIGTSTYIWTSLIGVILASLSLGYWAGGRLADKRPDAKVLGGVIFTAAGLVALTILIKDIFLSAVAAATIGLELKAVIAALFLFAPASICLGVVTPFAVRLKMTALDKTGSTVGRLYALSTIGSIAGTFGAGFFLLPFVGSVRTLYLIAASLVVLSIMIVPFAWSRTNIAVVVLLVLGIAATEGQTYLLRRESGLYDIDTEYSRVQVFRSKDPATGRPIQALATDPYFVQSAAFFDSDDLVLAYSPYYHLMRHFNPGFTRTLMIGGAGYSFPRDYLKVYKEAHIDVVEIDPGMTQIARNHFRLEDNARMNIIHEDGRMYVNRAAAGSYDVVLMDAFGSLFSVPHHLTTVEAVANIHRVLTDNGVVIFNLGSALTGDASLFFQAELATYRHVFPHVYVFKVNADYPDTRMQNLIIVASKSPVLPQFASDDAYLSSLLAHYYPVDTSPQQPILTDDLAPVEYYNSIAQNIYLANR